MAGNQEDQGLPAPPGGTPRPQAGPAAPRWPGSGSSDSAAGPGFGAPSWSAPPPFFPGGSGLPPRRGFFRDHPVLALLVFFLLGAALLTILMTVLFERPQTTATFSPISFSKKVGVVKIEGVIMDSDWVLEQLRRLEDDGSISAVVVRVDSPGGAVGASQEIYTEIKKLAGHKPVVVSMGNLAASGGYYVACPATVIFANPGTITGSIGVVMEIANLEGLFEWMKIKNEVVKSGEFKDVGSPYRKMTPAEREYLQEFVESVHRQFEAAVAEGRKLPPDQVHALANGKIYTGARARELGLVDELGNLSDAIAKAGELAGIQGKPRVVWPPRRSPFPWSDFMNQLLPGFAAGSIPSPVRVMYILDAH